MNRDFDWKNFLDFAKSALAETDACKSITGADEALCRTGISRAYYAAFHVTKIYAGTLPNFREMNGGVHEALIGGLRETGDPKARKVAVELERLRKMRVVADYDGASYPPRGIAGNAVQELAKAVSYAETIFKLSGQTRRDIDF